jgi:cytochrome o ubiquinol oxidase operon protein cyoD
MSQPSHLTSAEPKAEHGTTKSYIVGFLLSLIFTVIPYYLVVQHVVSGNLLVTVILGFAFLQMAIQIFFFLHLGRGPKPLYNVGFFVATFGAILVVVVGSVFIMSHLHANMAASDAVKKLAGDEAIYQVGGTKTGACEEIHAHHEVTITHGRVSPSHTEARLCDTLTFINQDDAVHDIGFGSQAQPQVYAGQDKLTVYKGHPKTITLSEAGTYEFHDNLHAETTGDFTVAP